MLGSRRDVTSARLLRQVTLHYDPLTNLPNRLLFHEQLERNSFCAPGA